jgi:hypothetical protein
MSFSTTILRIILCLSILLNGSGYAVATTQGSMSGPGIIQSSRSAAAVVAGDSCPGHLIPPHQGMRAPAMGFSDSGMQLAAKLKHATHDCCKSGLCDCASVHPTQASYFALLLQNAMGRNGPVMRPVESGHGSPRLLNLIRPPIG